MRCMRLPLHVALLFASSSSTANASPPPSGGGRGRSGSNGNTRGDDGYDRRRQTGTGSSSGRGGDGGGDGGGGYGSSPPSRIQRGDRGGGGDRGLRGGERGASSSSGRGGPGYGLGGTDEEKPPPPYFDLGIVDDDEADENDDNNYGRRQSLSQEDYERDYNEEQRRSSRRRGDDRLNNDGDDDFFDDEDNDNSDAFSDDFNLDDMGEDDDDDMNAVKDRREGFYDSKDGGQKNSLYDAYNLLHTLAQDFHKPFDSPAVVVVGHQSSGKSALIEALMGFQFNQVGGGTKTRRPVALRMQYNPQCSSPRCHMVDDDGIERPRSMKDIQDYIEAENRRLELDPVRCFDPREINVRMEYRYCPNMILIDTPGLISAPRVPRGRKSGVNSRAAAQQRALQASAKEAERLVVAKMKCPDYIILCVEDTMDWKHGQTREIVQKADPDLTRTVIVNTKLDTKVPQFGEPDDLAMFLRADVLDRTNPNRLGGPFFSSVPSGRVGRAANDAVSSGRYLFGDDDDFVAACGDNEVKDRDTVLRRLGSYDGPVARPPGAFGTRAAAPASAGDGGGGGLNGLPSPSTPVGSLLPRVGISRLRTFLEERVDDEYRRNVARILPLLQKEHATVRRKLESCERELESISAERLKAGADAFCDEFCSALKDAVQGSVVAPAHQFGETLEKESGSTGSFHDVEGCPMAVSTRTWDRLVDSEVGNSHHRLYGGSQYHRALREFNLASRCLRLPTITEDEIANAAGVGDTHDGVNFLRASCVIALEKARLSFDPLLEALRVRMSHVMGRLYPVSEYMLRTQHDRAASAYTYGGMDDDYGSLTSKKDFGSSNGLDITENPQFRQLVRTIFDQFVEKCSHSTMRRCMDDLTAMTRFVTWDLNERSSGALRRSLPDQTDIVSVYQVAVKAGRADDDHDGNDHHKDDKGKGKSLVKAPKGGGDNGLTPLRDTRVAESAERDYYNLLQLMEEAACSRDANRTNLVVGGLVQHIVAQWRESFGRAVTTKFNCYFLLPFVDGFHRFLREEIQKCTGEGAGGEGCPDVFDLGAARRSLERQKEDLLSECAANKKLQEKFEEASRLMREEQERAEMTGGGGNRDIREGDRPVRRGGRSSRMN